MARVPLQVYINRPTSLSPTDRLQDLLIGALVKTFLLSSNSSPASHILTGTDLQFLNFPVPTLLPIELSLLASNKGLMSTGQLQLQLPTPAPLHFVDTGRTVLLVLVQAQTVSSLTGHRSTCMLKRENCEMIRM